MTIDLAWLATAAALARWQGWRTLTIGRNTEGRVCVLMPRHEAPSVAEYRRARRENET